MTQRVIEITSPNFLSPQDLDRMGELTGAFDPARPLALEIGCGTGGFVLQMAQRHPETGFVAIDIYNKGCLKSCRKIDAAGLDNVRVARAEARYLLSHHVAPGSLSGVYINCPDPWPKKRHRNRRLVNAEFLEGLLYYLAPGAEVCFTTDFDDYAQQVSQLWPGVKGYQNCLDAPFSTELGDYPVSKYMRRFLERGQPIYRMKYRRDPAFQDPSSEQPGFSRGFRVRWEGGL